MKLKVGIQKIPTPTIDKKLKQKNTGFGSATFYKNLKIFKEFRFF
jgi:Fe2+ or Zn2+ uptake regulation protein